jgi:hypothetical protein
MAEYKGIHGTKVQNYTSDPANPIVGQVWYNETSQTMKVRSVTTAGAWATGGSLNTGRYNIGGIGIATAALAVGGRGGSVPGDGSTNTENYNGSAWTEVGSLNTARHSLLTSGSSSTSALAFGGEDASRLGVTEEWNGTSWTELADLTSARGEGGGAGTTTAALGFGGAESPASIVSKTESWNGTSWTEVNDLNTARYQTTSGMGRDYAAALLAGGRTPGSPTVAITESWNGTSWTEVGDLNTARSIGAGQTGTNTSALVAGGNSGPPPASANTEEWNGTSWTEITDLSTARFGSGGAAADSTSALVFGGADPANLPASYIATEEFTKPAFINKTITSS